MRFHIEAIKRRLDAINQLRIKRALSSTSVAFYQIYNLLPLLLHYNHPSVPGFVEGKLPHGICSFTMNGLQQQFINDRAALSGVPIPLTFDAPAIAALYSMGSTSSVGQNLSSDLDIWICLQSQLTDREYLHLQEKCTRIKHWAKTYNTHLSFFIIDELHFRHVYRGTPSDELFGSTQRKLLLEEFYRTAVRLAGKHIVWYVVPVKMEHCYDDYLQHLYTQGSLIKENWIDLGGLEDLTAEEYPSAMLWQLYKGIDSPYKTILKTLLLEAYAWQHPRTRLLALDFKQRLHSGTIVSFGLDPYCMILERITHYLESINDSDRLDLIRRCFYLKVCDHATPQITYIDWRREIVQQLVKLWNWDREKIALLDQQNGWTNSAHAQKIETELFNAMVQSAHNLRRFVLPEETSTSSQGAVIHRLTHKLHKTIQILHSNMQFIHNYTTTKNITFVYTPPHGKRTSAWDLYNAAPQKKIERQLLPLERNLRLSQLVTWAYLNHLLTPFTQIYLMNNGTSCTLEKLYRLTADLARSFPNHGHLLSPNRPPTIDRIRHITCILNLEHDPTSAQRYSNGKSNPPTSSPNNTGREKIGDIGDIDILYCTPWNEIYPIYFTSDLALSKALNHIFSTIQPHSIESDQIKIFCYSDTQRELIIEQTAQKIQSTITTPLTASWQEERSCAACKPEVQQATLEI